MYNLLRKATEDHTKTIIVSNAHKHWVDCSSETLMPRTASLMKERIDVISARVEPGVNGFSLQPSQWKIRKFLQLHEMLELSTEQLNNIIVVGDSMNEMNAG